MHYFLSSALDHVIASVWFQAFPNCHKFSKYIFLLCVYFKILLANNIMIHCILIIIIVPIKFHIRIELFNLSYKFIWSNTKLLIWSEKLFEASQNHFWSEKFNEKLVSSNLFRVETLKEELNFNNLFILFMNVISSCSYFS